MKLIVVKLGTNAILNEAGDVDTSVLEVLAADIATAQKQGIRIVMVSSGAVGAARKGIHPHNLSHVSRTEQRQILSAVGQPQLMQIYRGLFAEHSINVAQCLVTRSDFVDRDRQLGMRQILNHMLDANIIPICNENDFLTPEELDFSDNDQLASYIAGMLSADALLLLSNIDGLYTRHPDDPESRKIKTVEKIDDTIRSYVDDKKSSGGLGGMMSKIIAANILQQLGIEMILGSSRQKNIILDVASGKKVGTHFLPINDRKTSGIRVWLAAGAHQKGQIKLDCPLTKIFGEEKRGRSLLAVGVESVSGEFNAGDPITLVGNNNEAVGKGAAKISSTEMKNILSSSDKKGKVFVHADALFLY